MKIYETVAMWLDDLPGRTKPSRVVVWICVRCEVLRCVSGQLK